MPDKSDELPAEIRRLLKKQGLTQLKDCGGLDADELSLFEWYVREHATLIEDMLGVERAYIEEQVAAGAADVNDTGMAAVEYYIKRVRYSDIIYMASLLETYLERACKKLVSTVPDPSNLFRPEELMGDKWTKRKKFLERYGTFDFPESVWRDLRALILVRNNLVHDNGATSTLDGEERKLLTTLPGISANRPEMEIEEGYVNHCLAAFRSLVEFVENQLNRLVDRAIRPQSMK